MEKKHKCSCCQGTGEIPCDKCNGVGTTLNFLLNLRKKCYKCNGTGKIKCRYCHGTGEIN